MKLKFKVLTDIILTTIIYGCTILSNASAWNLENRNIYVHEIPSTNQDQFQGQIRMVTEEEETERNFIAERDAEIGELIEARDERINPLIREHDALINARIRTGDGRVNGLIRPRDEEEYSTGSSDFPPMRDRIYARLRQLREAHNPVAYAPRCSDLYLFLQTTILRPVRPLLDVINTDDLWETIYENFPPNLSDDMSVAVHAAMLDKTDDEVREYFRGGTINSTQTEGQRSAVYEQILHENDPLSDSDTGVSLEIHPFRAIIYDDDMELYSIK